MNNPENRKSDNRQYWLFAALGCAILLCAGMVVAVAGGLIVILGVSPRGIAGPVPGIAFPTATPGIVQLAPQASPFPTAGLIGPVDELSRPTLDAINAAEVPPRDQYALAIRLLGIPDAQTPIDPPEFHLGDVQSFYVNNLDTDETLTVDAELVYIADHVYMWVQRDVPYELEDIAASAQRFSDSIYETNRAIFGLEPSPGIDGDPRLHILHSTELGSSIAGYFGSSDAFPARVMQYSNEKEMFYINISNTFPGTADYDSTLAHEFQHMIHWNVDRNEASWINEGMSEMAAFLNGFGPSTFLYSYLGDPTIQLTTWPEDDSTYPHYGGAYLFVQYFYDRFGYEMVRDLVANPLDGLHSVDDTLERAGAGMTADDLFADWTVANLINTPRAGDGRYYYPSIPDLEPPFIAERISTLPYSNSRQPVNQYGVRYLSIEAPGEITVRFDGSEMVPVLPLDATNTDGDPATEDSFVWWSNRADDSNTALTRRFDLTGVQSATLTYDIWYWIENGWDFGYVEVSTDGGETFAILRTPNTSDYNPFGNAYGPGYTGRSSEQPGANAGGWLRESIDLSTYAGKEILVRFEMVNDDAVNQPGFAIDNICIQEVGFCDDAESDGAGWESAGFARINNILKQRFLVQVVVPSGQSYEIIPMSLDSENRGSLTFRVDGRSPATLIISGLTRFTTEPGIYDLEISSS